MWMLLLPALAAAQPVTGSVVGVAVTVDASSELAHKERAYSVGHLLDGDPNTAWVEGVDGRGEGQELRFSFGEATVEGFVVWPGYGKSEGTYVGNATPKDVTVVVGSQTVTVKLRQPLAIEEHEEPAGPGGRAGMDCGHVERPGGRAARVILFEAPVTATQARLRIDSTWPGTKWKDLPISEARPLIVGVADPLPGVEAARAWLRSVRDGTPGPAQLIADVRGQTGEQRAEAAARFSWGIPGSKPTVQVQGSSADGAAATAAFAKATRPQFVGVAAAVVPVPQGTWVIGARSGSWGDGEWVELSPAALLAPNGTTMLLWELPYSDGAPGCRDSLPEPKALK